MEWGQVRDWMLVSAIGCKALQWAMHIKHGYVSRVGDWQHSSFHRFVARGVLPSDWGGDVRETTGAFGE
jgi:hypothetical protein